ncbi:MAG: hypothetical protein ACLRIS_20180 [Flavonifractor plautii]
MKLWTAWRCDPCCLCIPLNAMDMVDGYGENNPIVVKSQFIMSLVERIDPRAGAKQKSIIDLGTCMKKRAERYKVPIRSP